MERAAAPGQYSPAERFGQTYADRRTAQADAVSHEVYDYAAVPFPEGYIDENELAMFQHEDIRLINAIGHLDDGEWETLAHLKKLREDLREGRVTVEELLSRRSPADV